MGREEWTRIIVIIVGAIIGAVIGYLVGQSALASASGAVIGAGIVAVGLGLILLVPVDVWVDLARFGQIVEYCSSFVVLSLACIVTLIGFLLWHSLALAVLAGVGVMTVLLVVLAASARLYKDASLSLSCLQAPSSSVLPSGRQIRGATNGCLPMVGKLL